MIPMTSALGAKFSHRLCLLLPAKLCFLLLGPDLLAARRANGLAIVLSIGFEAPKPVGIDRLLGKFRPVRSGIHERPW